MTAGSRAATAAWSRGPAVYARPVPTDASADTGTLSIVTDDPQFPLVRVPLKSSTKDAPRIFVEPLLLDFGYVPVGQSKTLSFQMSNRGGQTPLQIRAVENNPLTSTNYTLNVPAALPTYANVGDAPIRVDVTYRPQTLATNNEGV